MSIYCCTSKGEIVKGRANLHINMKSSLYFLHSRVPRFNLCMQNSKLAVPQRKEFVERRDAILEKYKAHANIIRRVKDLIRSVNWDERSQTCRSRSVRREISLRNLQFVSWNWWLFDSIDFEDELMLVMLVMLCWNDINWKFQGKILWRHDFKRFAFTQKTRSW